jgi:hypothetical protein
MGEAAMDTRAFVQRETPASIAAELLFARRLEKALRCDLKKLGGSYSPDFLALRHSKGVAWIELKCRLNDNWDKYPTYMIAVKKWEKCLTLAQAPNISLPWCLAVAAADGDYLLNVAKIPSDTQLEISMGGRSDRNWSEDIEPCVYIPKHLFKKVPA